MRRLLVLAWAAVVLAVAGCQSRPVSVSSRSSQLPMPAMQAASDAAPWPHEKSDIEADDKVLWGQLDNGFRYVIMPNREPPGRLNLRMYVASGSLNERDDQRGIAHFLEHMAFNGSKRYPDGNAMLKHFQELGLGFGSDVNAHTSFDETVYKLDLPKNTADYIDEALALFRDDADGLLLKIEDIDKERGVILSEKRDREDARFRSMVAAMRFHLPGLTMADRFPIGDAGVISKAPAQAFRDYYHRYYAANRIVLAVAGDFNPKDVEAMIAKRFGDLHRMECPDRVAGTLSVPPGLRTACYDEPEISSTMVSFSVARPADATPETMARRLDDIRRHAVCRMVNRRFEKLAKAPDARFGSADISERTTCNLAKTDMAYAVCKDGDWKSAVELLERGIRRACQFGFTDNELEIARAELLNDYETGVRTAATRKSRQLVDQLYSSVADNKVFSSPETNLELARKAMAGLTPDAALGLMRAMWDTPDIGVFVTGNKPVEGGAVAIRNIYEKSRAVAVTAPAAEKRLAFAYRGFGPAGTIARRNEIEDLGIRQIRFANNVRLNIKKTDFEKGRIRVAVHVGAGAASMPRDQQGLREAADFLFIRGGLKAHNRDDIDAIFAGRTVGSDFAVGEDDFILSGLTSADDLRVQFDLLCAYLTSPGYRDDAMGVFQAMLEPRYKKLRQDPMEFYKDIISSWIAGNDPRFGLPAEDRMRRYTMRDLEAWLAPQLGGGYVEISIVGDVDPDAAAKAVAATFGALPERPATKVIPADVMKLDHPWNETARTFTYSSTEPRAIALVYWPVPQPYDDKLARRLSMLGVILSDRVRVKVREEAGASYSPRAGGKLSRDYAGMGYLVAMAQVAPGMADKVDDMFVGIGAEMAGNGITAEEFDRAKNPALFRMRETLRDNGYWLGDVLATCQHDPRALDWSRCLAGDTEAITIEELNALARRYLGNAKPLRVKLLPEPAK